MKVSDYIVEELSKNGVTHVFGYQGGNITHVIDSICRNSDINFIENYNEQASAFAANAYAQITGNIGVAVASSGPGAINLISGIANAFYDSIPCIFITGNVNSKTMRNNDKIRQNVFQENDIVAMVKSVTKFSVTITSVNDIRYYLEKAIFVAKQGRPGPILLDIPHDIQRTEIDIDMYPTYIPKYINYQEPDMNKVVTLLKNSRRPVILLGGGARSENAKNKLAQLLESLEIPVVASLCGLEVIPHSHKCFIGFIGSYGNRASNLAVHYSDLIIVLGSRLDDRQIAGSAEEFSPNSNIIHVDVDEQELNRVFKNEYSIKTSVESFAEKLLKQELQDIECSNWLFTVQQWKRRFSSNIEQMSEESPNANTFLDIISRAVKEDVTFCADVGQHEMCAAQSLYLDGRKRLLNSAAHGAMGYALPAAIGSYYGNGKNVICVVGDGGIQMNLQELQVIVRDRLPVCIIVMNNNCLGMIREYQEKAFEGRTFGSVEGYSTPDFGGLAAAYNMEYLAIKKVEDYSKVTSIISSGQPSLIEVCLLQYSYTNPIPGINIYKQLPELSEVELKILENELNELK